MCNRKLRSLVATLLATATLGCRDDGPRTVIVDGWWARDFAVQACAQTVAWHREHHDAIGETGCEGIEACPQLMPVLLACTADSALTRSRTFEWQLARAMTREPVCAGLVIARHGGPHEQDVALAELMRRPHWMLAVDFIPGLEQQSWSLLSARDPSIAADGEGVVQRIAIDVCAAINRQGGL
jgi:hypothetical protein